MELKKLKDRTLNCSVNYKKWVVNHSGKTDIIYWCSDWPFNFEPKNGNFTDDEMVEISDNLFLTILKGAA